MAKPAHELKLNLLNNGLDFIQMGVRFFLHDDPDPVSHKYAILHLFSGLVLLLKERLRREHPSLIFKEVKEAGKPNAKTVDFDEVITRLEACASVAFDDKAKRTLRTAQGLRNLIEHYELTIDVRQAQAVIGDISELTCLFLRDELGVRLEDHVEVEVWERMQDLQRISARIKEEEIAEWKARVAKYCALTDEELEALADIEPYHPKHNPDPDSFLTCPECGEETVVQTEDGDIGVCTNKDCREVSAITFCFRCGERLSDGSSICDGCDAWIERQ
jgi:hypothetical protein